MHAKSFSCLVKMGTEKKIVFLKENIWYEKSFLAVTSKKKFEKKTFSGLKHLRLCCYWHQFNKKGSIGDLNEIENLGIKIIWKQETVFSVDLVCKEELNLMLKVLDF